MMRGFKYSFLKSLLSVLAFFAVELAAQSISTRYDGTNKLWIDANSTVDVAFRIEASADLQAWQEISDQASGPFSLWIDPRHDSCRFFRLRHWSTEELPITLMLIGDSTVADFISNSGMYYGWGDAMPGFFKPNVRLVNFALTMQSSETFLTSIQKDNMLLIKPEFVLVQFGMVDTYPILETTIAEYEANLKA